MKIPFSAYDFFAYLASGLVLIGAIDFAFQLQWIVGQDLNLSDGILVVLAAYVAGHLVAHFSGWIFERGFVRNLIGSPETHLLEPGHNRGWRKLFFGEFVRPFPDETIERVMSKARTFGIEKPGRGLFFHCHSRVKSCEKTMERLGAFLNQYGFCRNLSLALLVAAAILGIGKNWSVAAACLVGSVGMFFRYLKFFRHYTQEVYRTYSEQEDSKKKEN